MTVDVLDTALSAAAARRLNEAIGLDIESIGTSALSRAIKARARALGLADPELYAGVLATDPDEIKNLVEEIVIPETWFFRDREPFKLLARRAAERLNSGIGSFKVLSAPCSTGEEPYSIAMSLLEEGLNPARISVVGADISDRALAAAKEGVYGPNSFRGAEPSWAGHWFRPAETPECRRVKSEVRSIVSFRKANLAPRPDTAPGIALGGAHWLDLASSGLFDAVFCRNFLIYMDKPGKAEAADLLRKILVQDGLLFVGHAEMTPMLQKRFTSVREPGCFAYVNRPAEPFPPSHPAQPRPITSAPRKKRTVLPTPETAQAAAPAPAPKRLKRPDKPEPAEKATAAPTSAEKGDWKTARSYADRGELDRAETVCRNLIEGGSHTADIYHLLGVIQEARGNDARAREFFGKALYLDPNHRDGLYSMALLSERSGDRTAGDRFRDRLQRAVQRND